MSDPSEPTADHWRRRAAEATLPPSLSSAGAWCPAASGRASRSSTRPPENRWSKWPPVTLLTSTPRWRRQRRRFRVVGTIRDRAWNAVVPVRRPHRRPSTNSPRWSRWRWASRSATPHRRGPRRGGRVPLLRRGHRQTRGRTATHLRRQRRNGAASAAGGGRRGGPVELPPTSPHGKSPRAGGRQHGGPSNPPRNHPLSVLRLAELAIEAGFRPGVQCRAGPRRDGGLGFGSAPRCRMSDIHRINRSGKDVPALIAANPI